MLIYGVRTYVRTECTESTETDGQMVTSQLDSTGSSPVGVAQHNTCTRYE